MLPFYQHSSCAEINNLAATWRYTYVSNARGQ